MEEKLYSNSTWKEVCEYERKLYDERNLSRDSESLVNYATQRLDGAKNFHALLTKLLPHNPKILDLGGSDEPWFSYLCADKGMRTFTFDFLEPNRPKLIKEKQISFITDTVNNLNKYKEKLSDLDFIFCRNISPPQKITNWYEKDFVNIWKQLLEMLNENGVIYWSQMTNGTGKRNVDGHYFANHTAKYFQDFFHSLRTEFKITKYGYMSFKVGKHLKKPWNSYHILNENSKKVNLYSEKDYCSLIKHYALQLQSFYEGNDFVLNNRLEISGNKICSLITRVLLSGNFRFSNVAIVGDSANTKIKVIGNSKISEFTLNDFGYRQDDYFLIDEEQDKRFTDAYYQAVKRYL